MANSGSGSINTNTGTQHNYNNTGAQYNNCTFNAPLDDETTERWQKVRQWLSPPDQDVDHDIARARREPTTGEWLLRRQEYQEWDEGILWLNGKAGCGKTVLCSSVIEDLKNRENVLYFYFSFSDVRKQTLEGMLRSLAVQAARSNPKPWLRLMETPTAYSLSRCLQDLLDDQHIIVLDALDECPEDNRLEVLRWLARQTIRVFVTSRYTQDIADYLAGYRQVRVENSDIAADIALYAERQLVEQPRLAAFRPAAKAKIKRSIMQRADGMFRWATLLLDEMVRLKRSSDKEIEAALARFPQKLDDVYERILAECSNKQQTFTLLQWLTYATIPLTLDQLAEVLTIDVENGTVDPADRCEPLDIMRLLMSLVTTLTSDPDLMAQGIDQDSAAIRGDTKLRLAHFTVQEYLESTRIRDGTARSFQLIPHAAHFAITRACLTYLTHCEQGQGQHRGLSFSSPRTPTSSDIDHLDREFLQYPMLRPTGIDRGGRYIMFTSPLSTDASLTQWADRCWTLHSLLHDQSDVEAEVKFLLNGPLRLAWLKRPTTQDVWKRTFHDRLATGNHLYISTFNFTVGDDALSCACGFESPSIVSALCAVGAINDVKDLPNLLSVAVRSRKTSIVQAVLRAGIDPVLHGDTALQEAIQYDQLEIVRALLAAGARPDVFLSHHFSEQCFTMTQSESSRWTIASFCIGPEVGVLAQTELSDGN